MVISTLYALSEKSILAAMSVVVLAAVFLFSSLSYAIVIWSIVLVCLLLYRLKEAYVFKKMPQTHTMEVWYQRFACMAFTTAFLISLLGFAFIHYTDAYYQLFIVTVLVGITAASAISLSADPRIAIGYITIILFPLIAATLAGSYLQMQGILVALIILYYLSQLMMIARSYKQSLQNKELQESKMMLHDIFKEAPMAIFSYDPTLHITNFNPQFHTLFGQHAEEMMGFDLNLLPERKLFTVMEQALEGYSQIYAGTYPVSKDRVLWLEAKCFPLNGNGKRLGGIAIVDDKTKEHFALKELAYMAQHDELTGLLNRRGLKNYMQELVQDEKHTDFYSLLYYLDLDEFKGINDSLGHSVGDHVLIAVSERLRATLDQKCEIFRLGGDEFVIVCPYIFDEKTKTKEYADAYAQKIKDAFSDAFDIKGFHLHLQGSIGIIVIDPKENNIEEIIRHADLTMYQAKKAKKHLSYYDEDLDRAQKELFILQHELTVAIAKNQFEVFFQPIVSIKDNRVVGAETLIRWNHPTKGLLAPADFIPLAIKAGLLGEITWWMVDALCQIIANWKKEKQWSISYISLNVNARQLLEENFAQLFLAKLKAYHIESDAIMLEITERSLIDNFEYAQSIINTLQEHGVKCAIDDFGAGYSSLTYLKRLSCNTLKIDKEFIQDIMDNPKEIALLVAVLNIGRQFNYRTIVVGVENEAQKSLLMELDDQLYYQGFYFNQPMPQDEFAQSYLRV
ncbi:MAG: EAL domain-containing protein [Sulfurovum sp.]|nr:EAL domain-containing protein [Sulfurovum sp.]